VQTYALVGLPFSRMRICWRFGSKRRFVATMEWLRLFPKPGFFWQMTQTFDMAVGQYSLQPRPLEARHTR
jgi:hypothetical protein